MNEVEQRLHLKEVYISQRENKLYLSSASVSQKLTIVSESNDPVEVIQSDLEHHGFEVRQGTWDMDFYPKESRAQKEFVACVAYRSS